MSRATLSPPSKKLSPPRDALVPLDEVQHFVMEGASWELYERLLRDIGNRPIRVTWRTRGGRPLASAAGRQMIQVPLSARLPAKRYEIPPRLGAGRPPGYSRLPQ